MVHPPIQTNDSFCEIKKKKHLVTNSMMFLKNNKSPKHSKRKYKNLKKIYQNLNTWFK